MPNWSKVGYSDFDDCVSKNSDKGNPQAYCGEIRKQLECPSEIFEDERPPEAWFNNCVSSVSGDADDPEALCNWIWHHMHEQWTKVLSQGPKSDAERAKAHFNISDEEWAELSEEEKQAYIDRLPPTGTRRESFRHLDFRRIYDEFISYYKDRAKGESEYYSWLNALNLDERKEYGQAQESFKWAQNMLSYLREDDQYKYYKVLVGFPIRSMNGNVYKERDLVAAALTLKGVHPVLNHKNEWWFTPDSRWGEITTEDARYEDGAIEAIVKVSKSAICPICDGKPVTELIDSKRIVNVSLQGGCAAQDFSGVCDGFQFDDKGFSLLTSNVLPGIPMARIFPLESIMVEALRTSSMTPKQGDKVKLKIKGEKRRMRVKAKIIESNTPPTLSDTPPEVTPPDKNGQCPEGKIFSAMHDGCIPIAQHEFQKPAVSTFANAAMDNTKTVVGAAAAPDSPHFMKSGDPMTNKMRQTFTIEQGEPEYVDYQGEVNPTTGPTADTSQPRPEDEREGPPKTKPPTVDYPTGGQPEGTPPSLPSVEKPEVELGPAPPKATVTVKVGTAPKEQEVPTPPCPDGWHEVNGECVRDSTEQVTPQPPCPKGQHRDANGNCVPDTQEQDEPCPPGEHRDLEGNCVPDTAEQEEPCLDGYHRDEEGNCVPDEPLDERVKRIKAETKRFIAEAESERLRDNMKKIETTWVMKYSQLNDELRKQRQFNHDQARVIKELRSAVHNEQIRCEDLRVEMRDVKNQFADAASVSNKYAKLVENLKIENEDIKRKYHGALHTNLELSKKVTKSNEDYLELAKVKEGLEDKLTKARTNAKKTLKLRI